MTHIAELYVGLLLMVAALAIAARKAQIPYPILFVLGGLLRVWTLSFEFHQFFISNPPQRAHSMVGPPRSASPLSESFPEIEVLMTLL